MKRFILSGLCTFVCLLFLSSCGLRTADVDDINSETLLINSELSSETTAYTEYEEDISANENKRIVLEWSSGSEHEISADLLYDFENPLFEENLESSDYVGDSEDIGEVETGFLYQVEGISTISRNIIICNSVYGEAVNSDEVRLLGFNKDIKGAITRVSSVISVKQEYDRYLTGLEVPEIEPDDISEGQIITNMGDFEQATVIAVEIIGVETILLDKFVKYENLIAEAWGVEMNCKLFAVIDREEQGAATIVLLEFEYSVPMSPRTKFSLYDDFTKVGEGTMLSILKS